MSDDRIVLRSYRLAFELERRIHRIDRYRVPLPYGVALGDLGWGLAAAAAVGAATALPVMGGLLSLLPWPIRFLLLPGLAAHVLGMKGPDGRPAHERLLARALRRLRPSRLLLGETTHLGGEFGGLCEPVVLVPDERLPDHRAGVVGGAGSVHVRRPARAIMRPGRVELTPLSGPPLRLTRTICLEPGQRVVVQ